MKWRSIRPGIDDVMVPSARVKKAIHIGLGFGFALGACFGFYIGWLVAR